MKKLLALILALACALTLGGCGSGRQLAAPAYPEMARYPDPSDYRDPDSGDFDSEGYNAAYAAWSEGLRAQGEPDVNCAPALESFLRRSIPLLLSGEGAENRTCSPLNICMALAILAEATDGDSRAQILELLGSKDLESLRELAGALWRRCYRDDGVVSSVLANSLWLSDKLRYNPDVVSSLAENYYVGVFNGKMGSDKLNAALRDWVGEQTGGLLSKQAAGLETDPKTALVLASAVYFRAGWTVEFSDSRTEPQTFHAADGDVECDFMHISEDGTFYTGDNFSAYGKPLGNGGRMWFLLPAWGSSPEQIIVEEATLDFLLSGGRAAALRTDLTVNLALPKFDVSTQLELSNTLAGLGVTDVFDPDMADFSPLNYEGSELFLDKAEHAARVTVDEQGVTGSAYTVMTPVPADIPPETEDVDFVLEFPFVFAITSPDGLPLFVGIVNQP